MDASFSDRVAEPADEPAAVTIFVCSTCRGEAMEDVRPTPGRSLGESVTALNDCASIRIEQTACLANCRRPLSAALVRRGAWTYIFGDLSLDNAAQILDGARMLRT